MVKQGLGGGGGGGVVLCADRTTKNSHWKAGVNRYLKVRVEQVQMAEFL